MGSNIIELAKLGHERAAELKASCGAVDVRSLAQLISDLATQLEVQLVLGNAQAVQLANAESKCRELESDNEKAMESLKQADAAVKLAHEKFSALADENMALKSGHYNGMVLPETPATGTFLAEVLAQGADELAELYFTLAAHEANRYIADSWRESARFAKDHADQLRKGAAL